MQNITHNLWRAFSSFVAYDVFARESSRRRQPVLGMAVRPALMHYGELE